MSIKGSEMTAAKRGRVASEGAAPRRTQAHRGIAGKTVAVPTELPGAWATGGGRPRKSRGLTAFLVASLLGFCSGIQLSCRGLPESIRQFIEEQPEYNRHGLRKAFDRFPSPIVEFIAEQDNKVEWTEGFNELPGLEDWSDSQAESILNSIKNFRERRITELAETEAAGRLAQQCIKFMSANARGAAVLERLLDAVFDGDEADEFLNSILDTMDDRDEPMEFACRPDIIFPQERFAVSGYVGRLDRPEWQGGMKWSDVEPFVQYLMAYTKPVTQVYVAAFLAGYSK